jgi:hypothetical protein
VLPLDHTPQDQEDNQYDETVTLNEQKAFEGEAENIDVEKATNDDVKIGKRGCDG